MAAAVEVAFGLALWKNSTHWNLLERVNYLIPLSLASRSTTGRYLFLKFSFLSVAYAFVSVCYVVLDAMRLIKRMSMYQNVVGAFVDVSLAAGEDGVQAMDVPLHPAVERSAPRTR